MNKLRVFYDYYQLEKGAALETDWEMVREGINSPFLQNRTLLLL